MWVAVGVGDVCSGFTGHECSSGGVPGLVGHHDAGIQGSFRDEGQVERCGPDHADALDAGCEFGREREPLLIYAIEALHDGAGVLRDPLAFTGT